MSNPAREKYDFAVLADQVATALLQAAEDQVNETANLLASTKALAEGIRKQVDEQASLLADMNSRLQSFGKSVVEAHDQFLNGDKKNGGAGHGKDRG
jgi:conjugal transfer/entry exclusion protein